MNRETKCESLLDFFNSVSARRYWRLLKDSRERAGGIGRFEKLLNTYKQVAIKFQALCVASADRHQYPVVLLTHPSPRVTELQVTTQLADHMNQERDIIRYLEGRNKVQNENFLFHLILSEVWVHPESAHKINFDFTFTLSFYVN